ncbi:MAG: metallophosphoesterase [Alphaproteobacteria bacterium]|uniref:Metallophosphoesterase n=1 Tax=Candidatus Nitrobium versatile TaxID=2884831 RepID=A0A953JE37_9BACT|nr:metallophosphoesterase [Candidatus Nitrobium versatile]
MGVLHWSGVSGWFFPLALVAVLLWTAGFFSLAVRIGRGVRREGPGKRVLLLLSLSAVIVGFLYTFLPVRGNAEGISAARIGALYFFLWFVNPLLCLAGLVQLVRLLRRKTAGAGILSFDSNRRRLLHDAVLVSSAVLLDAGLFGKPLLLPKKQLTVRHYSFALQTAPPLTAAFISDLHAGHFLSRPVLEQIVAETRKHAPGCFLVGGDWVDHRWRDLRDIEWFIRDIQSLCPVIGVLGNHDILSNGERVASLLGEWGVTVLRDRVGRLPNGIPLAGARDLEREGGRCPSLSTLGPGERGILLTHNPDLVLTLGEEQKGQLSLVLAGHTHGGQVRIPGIGPLVNQADMRFQPGVTLPGAGAPPVLLTSGIGYVGLPLRINCDPEIVFLHIT